MSLTEKKKDLKSSAALSELLWKAYLEEPLRGKDNLKKVRENILKECNEKLEFAPVDSKLLK